MLCLMLLMCLTFRKDKYNSNPRIKRIERIERMCKNKFGSLDVGLIDIDEIKKLKKEDVMAMLKQAEHLQWKGPGEL